MPSATQKELRAIIEKWPGTAVLRSAFEFEIRKLIERGQTPEAIAKIKAFKDDYPDQAEQLVKLVVDQIQRQIRRLQTAMKEAVTTSQYEQSKKALIDYQQAYAGFAKDLYEAIQDLIAMQLRMAEEIGKEKDSRRVLREKWTKKKRILETFPLNLPRSTQTWSCSFISFMDAKGWIRGWAPGSIKTSPPWTPSARRTACTR